MKPESLLIPAAAAEKLQALNALLMGAKNLAVEIQEFLPEDSEAEFMINLIIAQAYTAGFLLSSFKLEMTSHPDMKEIEKQSEKN